MKFFETTFPANYSKGLLEEQNMDVPAQIADKIVDVVFSATATILNSFKKKDTPVVFKFERADKSLSAAAIVRYFENEDPKKPGNWNLSFTFDESDIPEGADEYSLNDPQLHAYFRSIAGDKYRMRFDTPESIVVLPVFAFDQIHKWLDENAKEGEEVSIELDGTFQARVAIEGGEKVFAIEPAGEIKMLIKDDTAIEK
jgi:hypothetical protein